MQETPLLILKHLVHNDQYHRAVLPYLKPEYFEKDPKSKVVLEVIAEHSGKYNTLPTQASLLIDLQKRTSLREEVYKQSVGLIAELYTEHLAEDPKWLLDITENYCQEQAVYLALNKSIDIVDGSSKEPKQGIPKILQDALAVCFDNSIGLDYTIDGQRRYNYYHNPEDKLPFDIDLLNKITKNGFSKKTLNLFLGGTNVGKTLVMCHLAAHYMTIGGNVLYISMEMGEEQIAERIDQNLLDMTQDALRTIPEEKFFKRLEDYKAKITGRLIVKQYPTGGGGVIHFKHLLAELKLKKKFVPDVIVVDYVNICQSSRIKDVSNLYVHAKAVAEELRGLAVETNTIMISATQTNRGGQSKTDLTLEDVSDSAGMGMTADFFAAIMSSDELEELGHYRFKQLKSRYDNKTKIKSFVVGVDKDKMKLYNIDNQVFASDKKIPSAMSKNGDVPWYDKELLGFDELKPPSAKDKEVVLLPPGAGEVDFSKIALKVNDTFDLTKPHGGLNKSNLTI